MADQQPDQPAGSAPAEVVEQVRRTCVALPEVVEEPAWVGTRWRIRARTFAHVLAVADGWPPVCARAAGVTEGHASLVVFRSSGGELDALRHAGHPWFGADWASGAVGLVITPEVDWDEVAELLTESYCVLAPAKLAARVVRPPES